MARMILTLTMSCLVFFPSMRTSPEQSSSQEFNLGISELSLDEMNVGPINPGERNFESTRPTSMSTNTMLANHFSDKLNYDETVLEMKSWYLPGKKKRVRGFFVDCTAQNCS